jgi:hypothetical protein
MSISDQPTTRSVDNHPFRDTITVSGRSHISDITFHDSANIITRISRDHINGFPFQFIEKNITREAEFRSSLVKHLKDGDEVVVRPFHNDWIIFIILIAAFFYASIRTFSGKLLPQVIRFFLFKGVGEPESRDTGELFHWQSTIINFISFTNIALFVYCAAYYYNAIPESISGTVAWLIALGIIILAVTIRHILCFISGRISGEQEVFNEYAVTFYQSYRHLAFIVFIIVILLSYTEFFSIKGLILTGCATFVLLYVIRVIRLFLIFIKRNVSILYLILYLCALEFLPVAVILKYVAGLF